METDACEPATEKRRVTGAQLESVRR